LKYEAVVENKDKKRERSRKTTLVKYGWTEVEFERQKQRQHGRCAGCIRPFTKELFACVDHDHATGFNRGLLCWMCNKALGMLEDQPQTLRRLMAYMDRRIDVPLVYLIGALKNPRIPHVGNTLRAIGFDVMDEWFTPGEHADTNWQAYEKLRGRNYTEALRGRSATNAFMFDRAYLDLADAVVFVAPAGKSAMMELGYAAGKGKRTIMFLDGAEPERYDIMPAFVDKVCKDERELVTYLTVWKDFQIWPHVGRINEPEESVR
jgi:nucleoside 2-deoxyribosyltransferase